MFDEDTIIRYQEGIVFLHRRKKEQIKVAEVRKKLHLKSIESCFEAEELAALQDYESEKALLFNRLKEDLEKKIDHAENEFLDHKEKNKLLQLCPVIDRKSKSKYKKRFSKPTRKRPADIRGGPYIVYMLKEEEIQEDLKIIRKALRKREHSPVYCAETFDEIPKHQLPEETEIEYSSESKLMDISLSNECVPKTKKFEKLQVPSSKRLSINNSNYLGSWGTLNGAEHINGTAENFESKCPPIDLSEKELVSKSKVTHISSSKGCVSNHIIQTTSNVPFQGKDSSFILDSDKNYGLPNIAEHEQSSQFSCPEGNSDSIPSPIELPLNNLSVQSMPINKLSVMKENVSTSKFEVPSLFVSSANDSSCIGSLAININHNRVHKHGFELNSSHVNSVSINSPINLSRNDTNIFYGIPSTSLSSWSGVNCSNTTQNELIVNDFSSGTLKNCTSLSLAQEENLSNYDIKENLSSWASCAKSIVPSCTDSFSRNYESSISPVCLECSCNNVTASEVICSSDSQTIPEEHHSLEPLHEAFVSIISETNTGRIYCTENPVSTANGASSSQTFTKTIHLINHQTDAELMFISDCEQITVETSRSPQNSTASEVLDNLKPHEAKDIP